MRRMFDWLFALAVAWAAARDWAEFERAYPNGEERV